MSAAAWWLAGVTAVSAVVDWGAVASGRRHVERIAKPLTTVLLVAFALAIDPALPAQRWWFVAALVASLGGDIALMFDRVLPGLGAFLLAHLLYVAGFLVRGVSLTPTAVGAAVVVLVALPLATRVVRALRADGRRSLVAPVIAYVTVISSMVAVATGTGITAAVVGAWCFYLSDALIGWQRFVRPRRWAPVLIMVTYHLAQASLVLSLTG